LFVLFLVAAASLPDEVDTTTDLRDFYAANRRNFWGLVVLFQLGYVAAGFYFAGGEPPLPRWFIVAEYIQMFAPLVLALILLATKSRALHYALVGLLFVAMFIHYGRASIN
jgi:hypothetical protein